MVVGNNKCLPDIALKYKHKFIKVMSAYTRSVKVQLMTNTNIKKGDQHKVLPPVNDLLVIDSFLEIDSWFSLKV